MLEHVFFYFALVSYCGKIFTYIIKCLYLRSLFTPELFERICIITLKASAENVAYHKTYTPHSFFIPWTVDDTEGPRLAGLIESG